MINAELRDLMSVSYIRNLRLWILSPGWWVDAGIWVDAAAWKDA
jgi:hypothetical protein